MFETFGPTQPFFIDAILTSKNTTLSFLFFEPSMLAAAAEIKDAHVVSCIKVQKFRELTCRLRGLHQQPWSDLSSL